MTYIDNKTLQKLLNENTASTWLLVEQKNFEALLTLKPEMRFICFVHGQTKAQVICHVDEIKQLKAKDFAKVRKVIPVEMSLTLVGYGFEAGDNFGTYEVNDYGFTTQFVVKD